MEWHELPKATLDGLREYNRAKELYDGASAAVAAWRQSAASFAEDGVWEAVGELHAHADALAARLGDMRPKNDSGGARDALIHLLREEEAGAVARTPQHGWLPHHAGSVQVNARRTNPAWQPVLNSDEMLAEEAIARTEAWLRGWQGRLNGWAQSSIPLPGWVEQGQRLHDDLRAFLESEVPPAIECAKAALRTRHPAGCQDWIFNGSGWSWEADDGDPYHGRWALVGATYPVVRDARPTPLAPVPQPAAVAPRHHPAVRFAPAPGTGGVRIEEYALSGERAPYPPR